MQARLGGLGFLAMTALIAYLSVYLPLHGAATGAQHVSVSLKGAIAIPLGLLLGVGMLAGGERFVAAIHNTPEKAAKYGKTSLLGWVLVVIGAGAGFGLYQWLIVQLRAMGYLFSGA